MSTFQRFTRIARDLPATVPFVGPEAIERNRHLLVKARIGANESGFGPAPSVIDAMRQAATETWKYTDPESFELRQAIAAQLGAIFNERVKDWEHHFRQLGAFWSSVTLGSGAYAGSPMQKHIGLPVDGRHFDKWLRLFAETAMETCPPAAARLFLGRAIRIAESLELAISAELGVILAKDERLHRPELDATLAPQA